MIYLSSISLQNSNLKDEYPFNIPVIKNLTTLNLTTPVVFFIGENGSGKSTLLEAIAAAANSITIGESRVDNDSTLVAARSLGDELKLAWKIRTHKGFFIRSEDVFGFHKYLEKTKQELDEVVEQIDKTSTGFSNSLARGAVLGQKLAFEQRYGKSLDANSHGETFLKVFQQRLRPGGLYLLDEPETPLSFKRQLSLLLLIKQMAEKYDCQFIIATHSPVLSYYPQASIYDFDEGEIKSVDYNNINQFSLMKDFLNNPETFLRYLED